MFRNINWVSVGSAEKVSFEIQLKAALLQCTRPHTGLRITSANSAQWLLELINTQVFSNLLNTVQALDLQQCGIGDSGVSALFRAKYWSLNLLTRINLSANRISDFGILAIAKSAYWTELSELDLSNNNISEVGAKALAEAGHLGRLSSLNLNNNRIRNAGVQALAQAQQLGSLNELHLSNTEIGDIGLIALAVARHLNKLTTLDISTNYISGLGGRALSIAEHFCNLNSLSLHDNQIGPGGIQALADATHLTQLSHLNLSRNEIGDLGAKTLSRAVYLGALKDLRLYLNGISDVGMIALMEAAHLAQLTSLNLSHNKIGEEGFSAFTAATHLRQITKIVLDGNKIQLNESASAFIQSAHLSQLIELHLESNAIGDIGALAISAASNLSQLKILGLNYNQIGNRGAQALANAPHFHQLLNLNLDRNAISDQGAVAIAESPYLINLESLELYANQIGDMGAQALVHSKNLPALKNLSLLNNNIKANKNIQNDLTQLRKHYTLNRFETKRSLPLIRTLLIGPPCAGKTILFEALTDNYRGLKTQARTQGFQRNSTSVVFEKITRDDSYTLDLTLDLWDLGGHSLQHMLHRLFFRPRGLYILVINEEALEQPDTLAHWLTPLANSNPSDLQSIVLPVLNPRRGKSIAPQALEQVIKDYRNLIKIAPPVSVEYFNDCFDIAAVHSSLRSLLNDIPIETYWQVHDEISEVVKQWQDDYMLEEEFKRRLQKDQNIRSILDHFIERLASQETIDLDSFYNTAAEYLDNAGIVTLVHPYIILNPRWVSEGLFVIFPPEPPQGDSTNSETPIAVRKFRERLQSVDNEYGFPGLFSLQEVDEALACKNFLSAERKALLTILSHSKLDLMINLESIGHPNTYLIPHYLDQFGLDASNPQRESELEKAIFISYQQAQACQIIDCDHWPEFFLYQFMVAYWPRFNIDKNQPLFRTTQDLKHINRRRIRIESMHDDYSIDLIFYQNRTWCFGYSTQANASLPLHNLIREVHLRLRNLVAGIRRGQSHLISMQSSFPCPKCMATLIKMAVNAPSQNESELLSKLKPGDGLVLKQILEDQQDAGGVIRCGNHFITRAELLGEQAPDSKQQKPPLPTPEKPSKADQLHVNGLIAIKRIADWKGYSLSDTQIGLAPATLAKIKKGVSSELAAMKRGTVKTITDVWIVQKGIHIDFPAELIRILKLDYLPNTLPKLNESLIKYAEALEQEPTGKRKLTN